MDLPRRSLILIGVGTLVTGCAGADGAASGAHPSARPTAPVTSAGPTPSQSPAALPAVRRWQVSPNDKVPACKVAAVRRIERDGTSVDRAIEVIDAQYGGLLADTASVLVVTRSWRRRGDRVVSGGRTYDVRLSRGRGGWQVEAINPSRPGAASARLAAAQRAVLVSGRIDLPPAARRDVESGRVSDTVLAAMLALSREFRFAVSVVRSGHPIDVFGTDRPSDHPRGRAFDTWSIEGKSVVDARTPRRLVTDFMQAVVAAGSYNVGGPYLLGPAPQWFSDDTHHDHVHAGFRT